METPETYLVVISLCALAVQATATVVITTLFIRGVLDLIEMRRDLERREKD